MDPENLWVGQSGQAFSASPKSTRAATMLDEFDNNDQEDFLNNISGKIQEEEFCRILDLRKNLQVSDVLLQHMDQNPDFSNFLEKI
jgi:hypothetical protein